jgi:hypothetical protein
MHKAPEAKQATIKIVLPPDTFEQYLGAALGKSHAAKLHTESCQASLNKAKNVEHEAGQAVSRLMRINEFANWSWNPMEWHPYELGGMPDNVDWQRGEKLETSMLHAQVVTHRRTDLKRMKHHVIIQVWKRELSDDYKYQNGGYVDYKYGLERYGLHALDCKFTTLEDADNYIAAWRGEFYQDHKEEIDFDRDMLQKCKAGR